VGLAAIGPLVCVGMISACGYNSMVGHSSSVNGQWIRHACHFTHWKLKGPSSSPSHNEVFDCHDQILVSLCSMEYTVGSWSIGGGCP
jgi:hypothetical protein